MPKTCKKWLCFLILQDLLSDQRPSGYERLVIRNWTGKRFFYFRDCLNLADNIAQLKHTWSLSSLEFYDNFSQYLFKQQSRFLSPKWKFKWLASIEEMCEPVDSNYWPTFVHSELINLPDTIIMLVCVSIICLLIVVAITDISLNTEFSRHSGSIQSRTSY